MPALYYSGPNRQPITADVADLPSLVSNGAIAADTLIWMEGMADWKPLKEVRPDLAAAAVPAPLPLAAAPSAALSPPVGAAGGTRAAHEIDYKILGEEMQMVEIELDPGETVIAEAGSMNYMSPSIRFETKMGDGSNPKSGFWDKMKQVGKRAFTGESLFMTHFTNQGNGKHAVAFASPYPGKIIPLDLRQLGGEIICQRDSFLCAALGTKVGIAFAQKLGVGLFGGEGFILQKLTGDGLAFVHAGGYIIRKELRGDTILVDTGCMVGFTKGINYDIQRAGNLKSMVFGGEGLFVATLSGYGSVWIQSLPFVRLAGRVWANAPGGTSSADSGSLLGGLGNLFGD